MQVVALASAVACGLLTAGCARSSTPDIDSLIAAENAFAERSVTSGTREAFLAHLGKDGVLFRPGPVNGREWYENAADSPGTLSWRPSHAEISGSGEFGYTTGPWTYEQTVGSETSLAHGHFLTVWRRDPAGEWKVAIDLGNLYPDSLEVPETVTKLVPGPRGVLAGRRLADARAALIERDDELCRDASARGDLPALRERAADDIRIYRNGSFPGQGLASLVTEPIPAAFRNVGGDISSAGDLGFTYGQFEGDASGPGVYLRVWRTKDDAGWLVVADVTIGSVPG